MVQHLRTIADCASGKVLLFTKIAVTSHHISAIIITKVKSNTSRI